MKKTNYYTYLYVYVNGKTFEQRKGNKLIGLDVIVKVEVASRTLKNYP